MDNTVAYRASLFHFLRFPEHHQDTTSYQYFEDGLLVVENGKVKAIGPYDDVFQNLPANVDVIDYSGFLIMPGFVDTHIHYAQSEMIASYGQQLLEWLTSYVFPAEGKHKDRAYARQIANFFFSELLRNGTTTAAVFSTVHKDATDALFECAQDYNMRIITGKTLMDRNAPEYLLDSAEAAYADSKSLIQKWHGNGRLQYAITPRFAPTSTEAQLEAAAALVKEFPSTYVQTHLSENKNEVQWVKELFPWSKNYTDIYDHYNLLHSKTILAHGVHLVDAEHQRLQDTQSVIAWCPTSNFFLGSGLFNLAKARQFKNRIGIATDVGGGSSFSLLRTLNEAYKVAAVQNANLSPLESFYYITLGGAKALSLEEKIGNFAVGKEADFLVMDLHCRAILSLKVNRAATLEDILFDLAILGDDRAIKATYLYGALMHDRDAVTEERLVAVG